VDDVGFLSKMYCPVKESQGNFERAQKSTPRQLLSNVPQCGPESRTTDQVLSGPLQWRGHSLLAGRRPPSLSLLADSGCKTHVCCDLQRPYCCNNQKEILQLSPCCCHLKVKLVFCFAGSIRLIPLMEVCEFTHL
jgi:hypothetical protein